MDSYNAQNIFTMQAFDTQEKVLLKTSIFQDLAQCDVK